MKTNAIRLATWTCVLTLAGCAQRSTATPGGGGGGEAFEVQFDESAAPPPDPNDPWEQPQDSNDARAEPQEPAQPTEPQQPEEPQGPQPTEPWDPWARPQQPDPHDPWAQPEQPQEPESSTLPHEPRDPPRQPNPNDPWEQPEQPEPWPWEQPQPAAPTTDDSTDSAVVPHTDECPRGAADFDADGLCDAAEAKYGTKVEKPDTDGDALSDGMEVYGIEFQGRKLDLAGLGANPLRRDVFLELDYVQGYRPHQTAILRVVDAFAAAGVTLHAEVGQQIAVNPDIPVGEGELVDVDFKQPNLDPLKAFVYRWALFAHSYDGGTSSGIAPYKDSWLLVTLGNFEFKSEADRIAAQAGTLMHELGHTFNLRHGGIDDKTNYKPNHMSVMNYHYQFTGVWRDGGYVLDYASYTVDGVSESMLSEANAFAPGEHTTEAHLARYSEPRVCRQLAPTGEHCHSSAWLRGNLSRDLDFNGNETIEAGAVSVDLNGNGTTTDYFRPALEEWSRLGYAAGNVIGNLSSQVSRHVASGELARCQSVPSAAL